MKRMIAVVLTLVSFQAFSATTFVCKGHGSSTPLYLEVAASDAVLGTEYFVRDSSYLPGNNQKKYDRFANESADLLVPVLMTRNKVNQGVVILYTAEGQAKFSCTK